MAVEASVRQDVKMSGACLWSLATQHVSRPSLCRLYTLTRGAAYSDEGLPGHWGSSALALQLSVGLS